MSQTLSPTLKATATATPAINKDCIITNNTTVDIVVLDAFADSDSPTAEQIYEQSLKTLSSTTGQNVIKAGTTATIELDDTHKDSTGNDVYTKLYDLVIARADNLYPISSVPQMLSFSGDTPPYSYKGATIAANDAKNMQLAENFYQTIIAYPSSTMAKNFQAAMSGATNSSGSDTDIDDAVAKFFKATNQYQSVTLNMIVSVSTYYSQFPFVWAGYKTNKTYYLYTSDGTTCSYKGSVHITTPSVVPASTDKSLKGFKFSYTDESNNAPKTLYYSNGQFVDDINNDNPNICLQGLFTLKSQLTKKDADNVVIAILTGTVNNSKVLGYDEKQAQDDQGNWSGLYTLLHPKDAMGWIQLFMTFMGVFMGVDFIIKALKSLKDGILKSKAENDGKDPSSSEVEQLRSEVKGLKGDVEATNQKLLDKMDENLKVTKDVSKGMDGLQTKIKDRLNEDQRSLLDDSLDTQGHVVEQAVQYGSNQDLVDLDETISTNMDALDNIPAESLGDVLPKIKINVADVTVKLKVQLDEVSKQASEDAKESFDKATQELDDANDISDKIDESSEDAANGDVPEDMEFEPMEF